MGVRKTIVDAAIKAMRERPDDFIIGNYTLRHKPSGQEFWIANGIGFAGLYQPEFFFGLRHGWRFMRAVARLKAEKTVAKLAK